MAGWTHYLCFDTFVARWIVNQAPDAGYKLSPVLFARMMFGPIGLLLYLAARRWLIPLRSPRPAPRGDG